MADIANAGPEVTPLRRLPGPTPPSAEFHEAEVERSIPDRFELQVRLSGDHPAVRSPTQTVTYADLNRAADGVARAVHERRGAGAEAVALLLEHDAPVIAAVIGVLKTGKFYVPLDPSYPAARNRYMLADSRARLIVTNDRNRALADELARDGVEVVNLDRLADAGPRPPAYAAILPDALAAIFYTSGTTGQPKGVMQNHRNVLHEVMKYVHDFSIGPEDRLSHIRSFCGVGASADIFTGLLTGATLYPLDVKEEGLAALADWLTANDITVYHSVPTVFRHFAETLNAEESFPKLRLVRLGGEVVDARDVQIYQRHFSRHAVLVNVLGTTETLTFRWCFFDRDSRLTGSAVPVGYEIDGADVRLLDEQGKEVGEGEIGEIVIGSRYHSPGYWGKPELTEAAFRPDAEGGDKRLYVTGDLGRMLPDGCLVHLGRKDFQVKIRGFRVEVSEVELALLKTGQIREAVVLAQPVGHGDRRLVAYVVPAREPGPTVGGLREALTETLPEYMIPSVFVPLEALPQLPNGKLDRRALPSPASLRPVMATAYEPPRTPLEQRLAGIWAAVLQLDRVGIHDNFFELGGHSLLATRIISRVRDDFGIEVPLRTLFDTPTIAGMIAALGGAGSRARALDG